MDLQFPDINYLYLLALVTSLALALFTHSLVKSSGIRLWLTVIYGFSLWTLGELLANSGTTLAWQLGFQRLVHAGVLVSVTGWLLFALHYAGYGRLISRKTVPLFLALPTCAMLMAMTLTEHSLMYRSAELIQRNDYYVLDLEYGLGFWVQTLACSYLYTLAGSLLLLRASIKRATVFRGQAVLVSMAALIPVLPNLAYLGGVDLAGGFDPTSLFFVVSAIIVTFATHQFQFLTLAPVARDQVFDSISTSVAITNNQWRITDVNPAFCIAFDVEATMLIGCHLPTLISEKYDRREAEMASGSLHGRLVTNDGMRHFDVSSLPVLDNRRKQLGHLVMLQDVTLVQKALQEIDRLAKENSQGEETVSERQLKLLDNGG
ncbi:MAG: histidine kinase N-terminal 7TM domain-containing protein [Pseudohongiella nitratireducens]|nr:histidine kinase N-terminal 7TM domain-containing protein [Pseudohongiella nitratireducens]